MNDYFAYDWIEKWANYTPEKLIFKDHLSQKQWSYSDFNIRTKAIASFLQN